MIAYKTFVPHLSRKCMQATTHFDRTIPPIIEGIIVSEDTKAENMKTLKLEKKQIILLYIYYFYNTYYCFLVTTETLL